MRPIAAAVAVMLLLVCPRSATAQGSIASYSVAVPSPAQQAAPGPEQPAKGSCSFVYNNPRYYQVVAQATLQGASSDTLVNDALFRVLRPQLMLAPCQLGMSEGTPCTSGTPALPCANPLYQCDNGVQLAPDVYEAAKNGDCNAPGANATLLCTAVLANPNLAALVAGGSCKPACATEAGAPAPGMEPPADCFSYDITIDASTKEAAQAAAASLTSPALQGAVANGLGGFTGTALRFAVVSAGTRLVVYISLGAIA